MTALAAAVTVSFITGLSLLRVWTNKPRNYNCLPAKSLIGGSNDISALLIFLSCRLASAYWGTSHTYVWWDEFNLSVRNDNRGHFNVMDDICQCSVPAFFYPFPSMHPIWDVAWLLQSTWTLAKADTDSKSLLISSCHKGAGQVATAVQFSRSKVILHLTFLKVVPVKQMQTDFRQETIWISLLLAITRC